MINFWRLLRAHRRQIIVWRRFMAPRVEVTRYLKHATRHLTTFYSRTSNPSRLSGQGKCLWIRVDELKYRALDRVDGRL